MHNLLKARQLGREKTDNMQQLETNKQETHITKSPEWKHKHKQETQTQTDNMQQLEMNKQETHITKY